MRSKAEVEQVREGLPEGEEEGQGPVLDEAVSVTGWSRDNARRRLTAAAEQSPSSGRPVAVRVRKSRASSRFSRRSRSSSARSGSASCVSLPCESPRLPWPCSIFGANIPISAASSPRGSP